MCKGNVVFQLADHDKGNFLIVNKEILLLKDEQGNPLVSSEAKILFLTIMSVSGIEDWELSPSGLGKILGWNERRVRKYLKELQELGYIFSEMKCFNKTFYKIFETLDKNLWKEDDMHVQNVHVQNVRVQNVYVQKCGQYSIHDNRGYNLIEDINNQDIGNEVSDILSQGNLNLNLNKLTRENLNLNLNNLTKDDSCNKETCTHDSTTTSTFSEKISTHDSRLEKFSAGDTKLNNSKTYQIKKKSRKTFKGIKKDGTLTKNKEELNSEKSKNSLSEVLKNNENAKILAEQTEQEQVLAKANSVNLEAKEMLRDIKAHKAVKRNTKNRRKDLIEGIIKKEESGELKDILISFFNFVIDSGKPVEEVNYRALRKKLDTLADNDETKIKIIEHSLERCWMDFYPLDNGKKDNQKFKPQESNTQYSDLSEVPEDELDLYEAALDENGNPLTF